MPAPTPSSAVNRENLVSSLGGGLMVAVNIGLFIVGIAVLVRGIQVADETNSFSWLILLGPLVIVAAVLSSLGHFTLQPNEARVLLLFGSYHGTVRKSGFFWANPFYSRIRARIPLTGGDGGRNGAHAHRDAHGRPVTQQRTLSAKISLRARNFNSDKLKVND